MAIGFRHPLSLALGALATATLGGCYYGDVGGAGYASSAYACETRYGSGYYDAYDPYAYDDGYGYDCYDGADYGGGFVQIGFGGGWYDNYYYPGYGLWMFDSYRNRYPLNGRYLNYWGGRRAWWMHRQDRPGDGNWNRPGNRPGGGAANPPATGNRPGAVRPRPSTPGEATPGRPGRGDQSGRPGGWNRGDGNTARPERRPDNNAVTPPTTGNPASPPQNPGTARPTPPATGTGSEAPRSGSGWLRRDTGLPGGISRPPAAERPARAPDTARTSAPPRVTPAPTGRPESRRPAQTGPRIRRANDQ